MEQSFLSIFTTSVLIFSFVIAIIVLIFRNIIETIIKKMSFIIPDKLENHIVFFWREWVLRGLPLIVGGLLAYLLKDYPFPEEFASSDSARTFVGIIAGLASSKIYGFAKKAIEQYIPDSIKNKLNNINSLKIKSNVIENTEETAESIEEKSN
jgi:hypothetical protein